MLMLKEKWEMKKMDVCGSWDEFLHESSEVPTTFV